MDQNDTTQEDQQDELPTTEQAANDSPETGGITAEGLVEKNDTTQEDQQDVIGHELPSSEGNNHVALTLAEFIVPEDANIMSSPSE